MSNQTDVKFLYEQIMELIENNKSRDIILTMIIKNSIELKDKVESLEKSHNE